MAQSRLERIGTIYSRVSSLIKGKAMKYEDRPLWYDIYEAFPPRLEPRFDRAAPNIPVRYIFYKEDPVRAKFQAEHIRLTTDLQVQESQSQTQKFLHVYNGLVSSGVGHSEAYVKALEKWTQKSVESRTDHSQDAANKPRSTNITDIFKE